MARVNGQIGNYIGTHGNSLILDTWDTFR